MRVLIFGDSITQGYWDSEGGWAARLRKYYDKNTLKAANNSTDYPEIFNLGISGDTATTLLSRIDFESRVRQWPGEEACFIISIGVNDSVFRGDEFESTPDKYREELTQIYKIVKKYADRVIFLGLTPCVDERVQPMTWSSTGKCYSNERIRLFDKTLREFCNQNSIIYIALFDAMTNAQVNKELMPDGIHPNSEGHELIFKLVQPELDKLIAG